MIDHVRSTVAAAVAVLGFSALTHLCGAALPTHLYECFSAFCCCAAPPSLSGPPGTRPICPTNVTASRQACCSTKVKKLERLSRISKVVRSCGSSYGR